MAIDEYIQDKIGHLSSLPTLPEVVTHLMTVVNDPATSAQDVAALVGQDLSLSAKILKLANSAFYGIPRQITSINNAVVILGLRAISTMVLSLTVFDIFPQDGTPDRFFSRKAFWHHSLACGLLAKLLAPHAQNTLPVDPDDAFCAGLLHDIGKVVMEQYLHDDFHQALKYGQFNNMAAVEAERNVLDYTHTDVADWLLEHWSLPDVLRFAITGHHAPQQAPAHAPLCTVIHYADWLHYHYRENKEEENIVLPPLNKTSVESLELHVLTFEPLMEAFERELEKAWIFYSVAAE